MRDRERQWYTPSGRFDAAALAARALAGLGAAGLAACGLAWLTGAGYWAAGYPALAAVAALSAGARSAVRGARCRNPRLAAAVAAGLGLAVVAGAFHADQCARWGVGWGRVDRLPGYV